MFIYYLINASGNLNSPSQAEKKETDGSHSAETQTTVKSLFVFVL